MRRLRSAPRRDPGLGALHSDMSSAVATPGVGRLLQVDRGRQLAVAATAVLLTVPLAVAAGGRGLFMGHIYTGAGVLVATVVQEVLLRLATEPSTIEHVR